jgi:hypothetical protein
MTIFSRFFIMLLVLLAVSCASQPAGESAAQSASNAVAETESADGSDPDEVICRREDVAGSNFRRRVCMTRSEREQRRRETQEAVLNNRNGTQGL